MRQLSLFISCLLFTVGLQAQVESLLKKAENNIEKGHLKEAIQNYKQALQKQPENRNANLGLGLIYSELLDNYPAATPYLEKALSIAVRDSSYDLIFALAKCYHYAGDYTRALLYYDRLKGVQDLEGEGNFEREIAKRRKDCEYARDHSMTETDKNIYIVNCGRSINTEMPEYVPVLVGKNELLFTSKRKDDKREELNYIDGKYFESMYITSVQPNSFTGLRRYTLPDKLMESKFYRHHQSVVSLSQDGKKLFTFRDSKLFEIDVDERVAEKPSEVKIKKYDHYENHAYLSGDGKVLYFTSDIEGGLGGTDIYKCTRQEDGSWGSPENLGAPVNTAFNEDAPFLSADGTLYFASEGHPGFGNFDIYKSNFTQGKWSEPANLGKPINSAGHDIFLVLDSASSMGYFSSGRNGGYGDMDLYKIIYLDKYPKDCKPYDSKGIWLSAEDNDTSDFKNTVRLNVAPNYSIISYSWETDGKKLQSDQLSWENDYAKPGVYSFSAKVFAWCDTCLSPAVACIEFENRIEKIKPAPVIVAGHEIKNNDSVKTASGQMDAPLAAGTKSVSAKEVTTHTQQVSANAHEYENRTEKTVVSENAGGTRNDSQEKSRDNAVLSGTTALAGNAIENAKGLPEKNKLKSKILTNAREAEGFELSKEQLSEMGYNTSALLFGFNKPGLPEETKKLIDANAEILRRNTSLRIRISGYADARGNSSVNDRISLQRAQNVKKYLLSKGIPPAQIVAVTGEGANKFLNRCSDGVDCSEGEHAVNRRVELHIYQTARVK